MQQPYLHVSYVSRVSEGTDVAEILNALGHFREKNLALGITGCIAFENDRIMQVIEGPREAVEAMFGAICRDPRHTEVVELERKPIERISFRHWGMIRRPLADVVFLTQLS